MLRFYKAVIGSQRDLSVPTRVHVLFAYNLDIMMTNTCKPSVCVPMVSSLVILENPGSLKSIDSTSKEYR